MDMSSLNEDEELSVREEDDLLDSPPPPRSSPTTTACLQIVDNTFGAAHEPFPAVDSRFLERGECVDTTEDEGGQETSVGDVLEASMTLSQSPTSSVSATNALDQRYRFHLSFTHHAADKEWVEWAVRRLEQVITYTLYYNCNSTTILWRLYII